MCNRRELNRAFSSARKGVFVPGNMDSRIVFPEFSDEEKRIVRNDPRSASTEQFLLDEIANEEVMLETIDVLQVSTEGDGDEELTAIVPEVQEDSVKFPEIPDIDGKKICVSFGPGNFSVQLEEPKLFFLQQSVQRFENAPKFVGAGRRR